MHMRQTLCRALALALTLLLVLGSVNPALAVQEAGVTITKIDNDALEARLEQPIVTEPEEEAPYGATDVVRVSILLEKESTLAAGFSTAEIGQNAAAMAYRETLKADQEALSARISRAVGEELQVHWNMTLAANIISADLQYGQIETVKAIPGVKDVVLETRYSPAVVDRQEAADPNMATSSAQIGSPAAYAAGYTGEGMRIAVIDTGIDTSHQSFKANAFRYSLQRNAEDAGMDYDTYVSQLDLLDEEEIRGVLDQLNIGDFEASSLYVNEKIPFGFNYVDRNFNLSHILDASSEHGSHVAGISAANAFVPRKDGSFAHALEECHVQGVAPDAQLLVMKVFGVAGGAYDSDYLSAIEDAILLGCDAINLSLGSANPGNSRYSGEAVYKEILDSLTECDAVVSISAGNSGSWAEKTDSGALYADGVSMTTAGAPGTYTNALTVASVDNSGFTGYYLTFGDRAVSYSDTASQSYANDPMTSISGEFSYVFLDGYGTAKDFAALGDALQGKIAICSRGSIAFAEKANAAVEAGAVATIIYNNTTGIINMDLTGYRYNAPTVSITQADAEAIRAQSAEVQDDAGHVLYRTGSVTVSEDIGSAQYGQAYDTMSSFSSWGIPGSLELKPEITAPGGSIYSVYGKTRGGAGFVGGEDQYEVMSGTSMAAPQISGMAALVSQYIQDQDLAEKTGLSIRTLSQSLLMSTAVPMVEDFQGRTNTQGAGTGYYPVLRQGAGLANVGAAISAESYILMGPDGGRSYADGKIKAELGDDPERTGTYEFSFTLYNLTQEEQTYDLSADLFTQDVYQEDQAPYLDTITTPLLADVMWTVDGKPLHQGQGQPDFDGNGLVDRADSQALLDYVTGARGTICNEDQADRNGDGLVTTYDVYLLLKELAGGGLAPQSAEPEEQSDTITLRPGASSEIHVKLSLEPEQKTYLDRNYPAGAYIQGYAFAKAVTTEEGAQGVTHSIPILGYYGSWSEPSMYDVGTYQDFRFGLENRNPYLGSLNGTKGNMLTIRYAGDTATHPFGGNPVMDDAGYLPQRNALNNQSGDRLSKIHFTAIRNAANAQVVVTDAGTGEVYEAQELGEIYSAYYHTNAGSWQNTGSRLSLDWAGTGKGHAKLPEGTTVNVSLVLAPEYYVEADGATHWEALADGAYFTTQVTIDNTDPEILQASYAGGQLTVEARDNQYLAAIAVYDAAGTLLDQYAPNQTVAAQTQTATFDLGTLAEPRILIQAYDYAKNLATYRITLGQSGGGKTESITLDPAELELTKGSSHTIQATVEPWVTDVLQWTTSDREVAVVNAKGVVTAVGKGRCVITATSTLSPEVCATCKVTVSTVNSTVYGALQDKEGNPMLYSWNLEGDDTWTPGLALDTSLTSLAYDSSNREFYLVDGEADTWAVHRVSRDTGKTLATAENPTGVPLWDMEYSQVFSTASSPKIAAVVSYLFMTPQDPMAITQRAFDMSSYLKKYTGASCFVAVASLGETDYEDQEGVTHRAELFLAMDNAGVPWEIDVYPSGEGYSASIGYFEPALPSLDFPGDGENNMYCSMTATTEGDMPVLYLSYFNGETNELYRMPYVDGAFSAELVGDVGEGVWPAAVYSVVPNGSGTGNARPEPVETFRVEDTAFLPERVQDSLHAAQAELSGIRDGQQTERHLEVEIVADVALTNGLYELTFDPEQLSYDGLSAGLELTSVNRTTGKLVFGFADGNGAAQDAVLATVRFRPRDAYTCEYDIALTSREMNDTVPGTWEQIRVGGHSWDGGVVTKAPTYQAEGERVYTCTICGAKRTEVLDRLVLDRDCHGGSGCPSRTFTDVPGTAWYHGAVDYMVAYGLMQGTSSTTFRPHGTTTRAMLATILYRMEGCPVVGADSGFRDVPAGTWYSDAVTWASEKGIVVGYGNGSFGPHDTLTREQMAVLLYRYAGYQMADTTDRAPLGRFSDSGRISDWAYEAVSWAVAQGILMGSANGNAVTLNPTASATRAELAAVLMRYQER